MNKVQAGLLVLLLAISMLAAGTEVCAEQKKWRGYMVDRQCADAVREDNDPKDFLQHHTKDCALMPNCRTRGYSLYSGGKWFYFDKTGNDRAVKLLQASKRKSGFLVEVSGTIQGQVLKVETIREVSESNAK